MEHLQTTASVNAFYLETITVTVTPSITCGRNLVTFA